MKEFSISQAQMHFTKLLDKISIIVDKKSNIKKAVILPYSEYQKLIKNQKTDNGKKIRFDKFAGVLSKEFESDDERYNKILS